jgi:hypothetical protein
MVAKLKDQIIFWATTACYTCALLFLVSAYTGSKVLPFKWAGIRVVRSVYSSGWAFFVALPDDPVYNLYEVSHGRLQQINTRPFSLQYCFGLNRKYRVLTIEAKNILTDSAFLSHAASYNIEKPWHAHLNQYLKTDTLHYTQLVTSNAFALPDTVVFEVRDRLTWQQERSMDGKPVVAHILAIALQKR